MLPSKSYGEAILVREIRMVQVKKRKLKKKRSSQARSAHPCFKEDIKLVEMF